jgi:1,4-alpha-glucan branching enzyme
VCLTAHHFLAEFGWFLRETLAKNESKSAREGECGKPFRLRMANTMKTNTTWKQSFSFKAPGAHRVLLAGDFTHWMKDPIPLHKQPDGVWKAIALLTPGTYHYRFLVDGDWRDDPECKVRVQNPFGTLNSVVQVGSVGQSGHETETAPADAMACEI